MFRQAGKLSNRSSNGSNSSNGSSNVVVTLGSSNEVVISSVVGVVKVALILNLDRVNDGLSNGGATAL